jgi:hypothetical protein
MPAGTESAQRGRDGMGGFQTLRHLHNGVASTATAVRYAQETVRESSVTVREPRHNLA